MKICLVERCSKPKHSKGMCGMHAARFKRHGHTKETRTFHGLIKTPEYKSWSGMKDRVRHRKNYIDKGIKVCDRWNEFSAFLKDMGTKPGADYSIERINNDGDYEPSNCVWANATKQTRNRGVFKNNTSGAKGVYWHKRDKKWHASICVNYKLVSLGYFKSFEEAFKRRTEAEKKYWSTV